MTKAQEKKQEDVKEQVDAEIKDQAGMTKAEQGEGVVRTYMLWAMAAGIAPVIVDSIAISGLQVKMLHSIAKIYGIPFSKNVGKSITASMIGGIGAGSISRGGIGMMVKMIPFVGPIVGTAVMPVMAGGATYAIGKLFIQHFESGGTFLSFDPAKMKEPLNDLYSEGKNVASKVYSAVTPSKKEVVDDKEVNAKKEAEAKKA